MKQVLLIHGGSSYESYDSYLAQLKAKELDYERLKPQQKWKSWMAARMPGVDVLVPTFPNGDNAVYDEWVIYFEKILPFLKPDAQIVGHSLGAMFLAKYLHDHVLPRKIRRLVLVAGAYGDDPSGDSGSFLVGDATGLERSAEEIHLFHSEDDPIVPFAELAKFQTDIPNAVIHRFKSRGHFLQPTFPELLELLKQK